MNGDDAFASRQMPQCKHSMLEALKQFHDHQADGQSRQNLMAAIELLARRIAIDMLESNEFKATVAGLIDRTHESQVFQDKLHDMMQFTAATVVSGTLESAAFSAKVGEIASNMIGQNMPVLLECDEFRAKVIEIIAPDGHL